MAIKTLGKARIALRKHLLDNKDKVRDDLKELREKFNSSNILPEQTSSEFKEYLKTNEYEIIDEDIALKDGQRYSISNIYRHFLNIIEFGK